ncbi:MAG: hypothetical protein HY077_12745 [Elusimicrobia bacterium]|nr:hypothetical protein [Elusimicrobiota bacterium]
MNANLFVGGFPYETTPQQLSGLFASCGKVVGVKILTERETGRSRGIGFVEMSSPAEASAAISKLDGSIVGARKIFVSEARPQEKKEPRGFAAKPGFVERRSGKDRRQGQAAQGREPRRHEGPAPEEGRREGFFDRKKLKWVGKPAFSGKKKWEKRPSFGEKKPGFGDKGKEFGPKKKWGPGGPGGGKKWPGKPKRFGSGFGGRGR